MNKPAFSVVEDLVKSIKEYVENRVELFTLKLVDKATSIASSIISGIIFFIAFFISFIALNIGIALLVGGLLGKAYLGFLIVAGFYAIAGLVLYFVSGRLIKSALSGMLIRKIYKNAKQKDK